MLHNLGRVVATAAVAFAVPHSLITALLDRHATGDWGDLDADDKAANEEAARTGDGRLFSSYATANHGTIWGITNDIRGLYGCCAPLWAAKPSALITPAYQATEKLLAPFSVRRRKRGGSSVVQVSSSGSATDAMRARISTQSERVAAHIASDPEAKAFIDNWDTPEPIRMVMATPPASVTGPLD